MIPKLINNLKRFFGIGLTGEREQKTLMKTDAKQLKYIMIPVAKACMLNHATYEGYLIDTPNQVKLNETGEWIQLLYERSTLPLDVLVRHSEDRKKKLKSIINMIFKEARKLAKYQVARQEAKSRAFTLLCWLVSMPVAGFLLIVAIREWRG